MISRSDSRASPMSSALAPSWDSSHTRNRTGRSQSRWHSACAETTTRRKQGSSSCKRVSVLYTLSKKLPRGGGALDDDDDDNAAAADSGLPPSVTASAAEVDVEVEAEVWGAAEDTTSPVLASCTPSLEHVYSSR